MLQCPAIGANLRVGQGPDDEEEWLSYGGSAAWAGKKARDAGESRPGITLRY